MITASFRLYKDAEQQTDIPVINPGGWFGKCWLVEIGLGNFSFFVVVEADTYHDAQDEFSDDKKYGPHIHVLDEDLYDYPEDSREYDGSGRVIDTDHMMIHGPIITDILYHGDNIPSGGVTPPEYMDKFVYDQHDE